MLRMPDFVSDEQVILVDGHLVELRQHQFARLNVEHRGRHVRMRHGDVLTCEKLGEPALGFIQVGQVVPDGHRWDCALGGANHCFIIHTYSILHFRESCQIRGRCKSLCPQGLTLATKLQ